ncbi:MAG: hypothetical protein V3T08_02350 [Gemmatimonadota bacterium]
MSDATQNAILNVLDRIEAKLGPPLVAFVCRDGGCHIALSDSGVLENTCRKHNADWLLEDTAPTTQP